MPLTPISSFGVWTDDECTIEYSGFSDLEHNVDLSDNPNDLGPFYIASPLESPTVRTLQTTVNPGVDEITLTPVDVVPEWESEHAYTVGQRVQPVGGNGRVYACTTSGTSDTDEPDAGNSPPNAWPTSGIGSLITDGTVVWQYIGAKHEITEVKLATTLIGLDSAIAGAPLSLGTEIENGIANAVTVYIRVDNAVLNVSQLAEDIDIKVNSVTEV